MSLRAGRITLNGVNCTISGIIGMSVLTCSHLDLQNKLLMTCNASYIAKAQCSRLDGDYNKTLHWLWNICSCEFCFFTSFWHLVALSAADRLLYLFRICLIVWLKTSSSCVLWCFIIKENSLEVSHGKPWKSAKTKSKRSAAKSRQQPSKARSKWEDVSDNIHKETVTNMTKANESSEQQDSNLIKTGSVI